MNELFEFSSIKFAQGDEMRSDETDTWSEDETKYRDFVRRAQDAADVPATMDDTVIGTVMPQMLVSTAARYLWDVNVMRGMGKAVAALDVSTILRNARHELFMTDQQYARLDCQKREWLENVVAEMLKRVSKNGWSDGFVSDPAHITIGFKLVGPDDETHWMDTAEEVFEFAQNVSEEYLGTWEIGTVFADGYVNFDNHPRSSGFSADDLSAASTANVFRHRLYSQQWDEDSELPFADPSIEHHHRC